MKINKHQPAPFGLPLRLAHVPGTIDWQDIPDASQTVYEDDESCDRWNQNLKEAIEKINDLDFTYYLLTNNSNAVAFQAVYEAGQNVVGEDFQRPSAIVNAPGADTNLFP